MYCRNNDRFAGFMVFGPMLFVFYCVAIIVANSLTGNGTIFSQVLFFINLWIVVLWSAAQFYLTVHFILDGNPATDVLIGPALITLTYVQYFMTNAMLFFGFWVLSDTVYWSGLPLWSAPHASFIAYANLLFTSELSNGVGFGLYIPLVWQSQLTYAATNFYLYAVNILAIGQAASIIVHNRAMKHKFQRRSRNLSPKLLS